MYQTSPHTNKPRSTQKGEKKKGTIFKIWELESLILSNLHCWFLERLRSQFLLGAAAFSAGRCSSTRHILETGHSLLRSREHCTAPSLPFPRDVQELIYTTCSSSERRALYRVHTCSFLHEEKKTLERFYKKLKPETQMCYLPHLSK